MATRPKTINEEFFDALIRHQIFLLRNAGAINKDIITLLNDTERDLANKIRDSLTGIRAGLTPGNIKRIKILMKEIEAIRSPAWDKINDRWFKDFRQLIKDESIFMQTAASTVLPVIIELGVPSIGVLSSMVTHNPFQGKTMREWASSIRESDLDRILTNIRIGLVQGETGPQIARRIVGTARLNGTDGTTQITRRGATAITRTAVIAFSNMAKREFYLANPEIVKAELYVATLDSRTTAICRSLDGKIFDIGIGPIPPLHFNCRSVRVGFFDGAELATRPFNSSTQKSLVEEFAHLNNIQGVVTRARLPRGFKGEYDIFARQRIKELTGVVPAKVNYQEWLSTQTVQFQDEILGNIKGRLFRKGGLSLDRFVNRRGDELSLQQLAVKDRQAFIDAGLNPNNFN